MNRVSIAVLSVLLLAAAVALAAEPAPKSRASPAQVARGKYLVEQVGMCADCHSPRDQKGEFIREKWLQGSELDFKATVPMPKWAAVSPPIAGLPGWSEANPPMPQYRMTRDDATAVVAYLRSLPPPGAR